MLSDSMPKAIFGDNLWGDKAMRFLFMDEAGTSGAEHESVRVVVSILVNADTQLMQVEAALREALGAVPSQFAKKFVFHADDIWSARKYRDSWPLTDRKLLLESVMSIPKRFALPICLGLCWSDTEPGPVSEVLNLSASDEHLFWAFHYSVSQSDRWLRKAGGPSEIGTIVAEQNGMKRNLGLALRIMRESPFTFPNGSLAATEEERRLGYVKQDGTIRVTRIRPTIHWVEKGDDPLVWLADACAFGLKRYFAKKSFGEDFCRAALGSLPNIADYKNGPVSGATYCLNDLRF